MVTIKTDFWNKPKKQLAQMFEKYSIVTGIFATINTIAWAYYSDTLLIILNLTQLILCAIIVNSHNKHQEQQEKEKQQLK